MGPVLVVAFVLVLATSAHEFGHMLAARARRARVLRVSIGRGARIARFRRGKTLYEIGLLPIGGRVDYQRSPTSTANAVIAIGGAVGNIVAGFLILAAAALLFGTDRMPFGDSAPTSIHYATDLTRAWLRVVPATIVELVSDGRSRTLALAVDTLRGLILAQSIPAALHAAAAVSFLWATLNMIPIPGVGTDGWRFLTALFASFFGAPAPAPAEAEEPAEGQPPETADDAVPPTDG